MSANESLEESVIVPVEDLGTGLFNVLGDVVGGLVNLHRVADGKAREGLAILKEKISKSSPVEEEAVTEELPIDPALRPSAHHARFKVKDSIDEYLEPVEPLSSGGPGT
ncbi:MAG: hypothetical protein HQL75_14610 [Magnetococcales bacterium]|nr:hypothetical protein [Magnetococcales bacterium]